MNGPLYNCQSTDYMNDDILSPANCFFDSNLYSMSIDPTISIQEATPQESPMNSKNIMNMSISIPEEYNNLIDMNNYISPLTSPFDVDPNLIFFPSTIASPTFDLFNGENLNRRYSTPSTLQEYMQFEPNLKKSPTKRRSSLRKTSTKPDSTLKLFVCEEEGCNKVFKRSEHLKRHIKSIHSKERPYECKVPGCNKKFARSDNLNQHARIHRTNEEKLLSRGFTSFTPYVLPPNIEQVPYL